MNIFTAFLAAMKGLVETKGCLGQDDVKKAAVQLIMVDSKFHCKLYICEVTENGC